MIAKSAWLAGLVVLAGAATAAAQSAERFRELRLQMVEDAIVREGVSNRRVLDAVRQVPRHEFVSSSLRSLAYNDAALPIGHGQTISSPFIVAYMTESIDPQDTDRVLEIGTGSGYQAAVLSPLVAEVYTIEIVEPLARTAEQRLKRLGYENVKVKAGDGYQGWPDHAPFDKIIVTCSPEAVPQPLVEQLKEGGRMIIPLGQRYQQVFYLFEKQDGRLVQTRLVPTLFVPMTGVSEEERKLRPDPHNPQIVNGGFETVDTATGLPAGWHYQRQARLVTGDAVQGENSLCFENEEPGRQSQALQGMAVDGRHIGSLVFNLAFKHEDTALGNNRFEQPGLMVHFYDSARRPLRDEVVGPWLDTEDWRRTLEVIRVPHAAREMIVRIGLNGGTGRLCVDDLQMEARPR